MIVSGKDQRNSDRAAPAGRRSLDFIIIGAQKGGTTSLWEYLRGHPRFFFARFKEAPFFLDEDAGDPGRFESFMQRYFADAPPGAILGKATTRYMIGSEKAGVEVAAERISSTLPAVKLIAVLRDPIERAVSGYVMAARQGLESRSIDVALRALLDPEALIDSRRRPLPTNTYVALGEYGRILKEYREHFPAEQMLVVFTHDLARNPGMVLDTVLGFLGLPTGFRPANLDVRYFRGGQARLIDSPAEESLLGYLRKNLLPYMSGDPAIHKNAFLQFYRTWNVKPGNPPDLATGTRQRLEEHFRDDAAVLAALDVPTPWIAKWSGNP